MTASILARALLISVVLLCAGKAQALVLGQADTFEDGTVQGWVVGLLGTPHPAPPDNVLTGGPDGVDDNFLLLTSLGGGGAGSRFAVSNLNQWTGDYVAAAIQALRMDVNNIGSSDLYLRLSLSDPLAGPSSNLAFSTDAVVVPAGSGWTSILLPLTPIDLTAGLGSVAAALSNATELRLYHSVDPNFPNPSFPIDAVSAQLGVDNIQATVVPEPATSVLFGVGLLGWCWTRRGRLHGAAKKKARGSALYEP